MADSDDLAQDESLASGEARPRAKNNLLTIVLLLLNVVFALAFVYLLVMDYEKRQQWSYAVFMHDLALMGVPLEADEKARTAAQESLPRQHLSAEQLKAVLNQRGGRSSEPLAALDEVLQSRIKASELTPDILRDHFGDLTPVRTLEEEVRLLQKKLSDDLTNAAKESVAAIPDEAGKRKLLEKLYFSLAVDVHQVDKLDAKVKSAAGNQLDDMLQDAILRRMYIDLLAPLEQFRAGNAPTQAVQKVADLDNFKLEQLRTLLESHLNGLTGKLDPTVQTGVDWYTLEKRRAIAFFLVDLAFLTKPDGQPLYPQALARAERVAGLYDFPIALQRLTRTWVVLEADVLASIKADREGFEVKSKDDASKVVNVPGWVGKHQNEIERILDLKRHIKQGQDRLARLQDQYVAAQKLYNDRKAHQADVGKRLVAAREKTARQVAEVRVLQNELFAAQKLINEAYDHNARLESENARLERELAESQSKQEKR